MKKYYGLPPQILLYVINVVIDIVEGLLVIRLSLALFGASSVAPFVRWIRETTDPLVYPFVGMFPSPNLTNGFTIEFSALFAIIFYAFIGYLATEVVETLIYLSSRRYTDKKQI